MELILVSIVLVVSIAGLAIVMSHVRSNDARNRALLEQLQREQQASSAQAMQTMLQTINAQRDNQDRQSNHLSSTLQELRARLSEVQEGSKQVLTISKSLSDLQSILQAPKLRGTQGETWLEELLGQILPKTHFSMQYQFRNGVIADAVIKLRDDRLLPIDSKFSLENFRKFTAAQTPEERLVHSKAFASDVKKRIDEIGKKYIIPDEGTLNFAFMYVPAENVYYQAFIEDQDHHNLQQYAFLRRVIPVSPNSLYPYLEIVLLGLRGLQIEQDARRIQDGLVTISQELERFMDEYRKVGENIRRAQQNFELSSSKANKLEGKLASLAQREQEALPSPDA
jgi:DNA recombination protein RmuC